MTATNIPPLDPRLLEMFSTMAGHENLVDILVSTSSPTAVRLNPRKLALFGNQKSEWKEKVMESVNTGTAHIAWEPFGYYLEERPDFHHDPALYGGLYYVQDPSSMIIGEAVRRILALLPGGPIRYLDACAAPGGKTTSALAALPEGSFILANEYDVARVHALVENLERWGYPDYVISRNDARNLSRIGPTFDIVAADVPCSGEGMIRKNPTARSQWSPGLIKQCVTLQRQILESVWETLIPGGYLLYSTCTFNTAENEENVAWLCETFSAIPIELKLTDFPGVLPALKSDIPAIRMVPGHIDGEGQFLAVVQKPLDQQSHKAKQRTTKPQKSQTKSPHLFIDNRIIAHGGEHYAIATEHYPLVANIMASGANVIVPGVHVGTPKGRLMAPAHPLALSTGLRKESFPTVDLDPTTAIQYLQGQALQLPTSTPRGYVLITSQGTPLGWVNNIGSRANNLLPANRRIR